MKTGHSIQAKRSSMLCRRKGMAKADFFAYWAGPHADIARQIPGVTVYTQNRIVAELWSCPDEHPYNCDGIVELEFQDAKSRIDAGTSDAVSHMLPQDELNFLDDITLCLVDGGVPQLRPGWIKVMLAGFFHQGKNTQDLEHLIVSNKLAYFSVEKVHEVFGRPALAVEPEPPHVFASVWFSEEEQLSAFFGSGNRWDQQAREILQRCTVWRIDPLAIIPAMYS